MIGPTLLLAIAAAPPTPVEAERAFAALAHTNSQWTAFRAYAAEGGSMFVPQTVQAQQWLRDRKDPPVPVMWWPGRSWLSCDGSTAVNTGSWVGRGGKSVGYFTTVWAREKDGSWKWLLDHGDTLKKSRPVGDAVRIRRAKCNKAKRGKPAWSILHIQVPGEGIGIHGDQIEGKSGDRSLRWKATVLPDDSRQVTAEIWTGAGYETIIDDKVKAP